MKNKTIRISKRDIDIIKTINSFGYVNIKFIARKYQIKRNAAYRRLRQLIDNEFLIHQYLFHHKPGIYRATAKGVSLCNDELPPVWRVSHATAEHTITVSEAMLALNQRHQCNMITERQLRHKLGKTGVGQSGHVADGVLFIKDKKIALEVELTVKAKERIAKILLDYAMQLEYDEVWYICDKKKIFKRYKELEPEYQFIKCFLLKDVLNDTSTQQLD